MEGTEEHLSAILSERLLADPDWFAELQELARAPVVERQTESEHALCRPRPRPSGRPSALDARRRSDLLLERLSEGASERSSSPPRVLSARPIALPKPPRRP